MQATGCEANVADAYFCYAIAPHLLHFLPSPVAWASALRSRRLTTPQGCMFLLV
ncbi:hypothetical protein [Coleofasciculus sp. H7-2]|uniref:hypothetical protein n=1 Tax=Coleofasciculus sp. H7-2 TaxID=3351545 RepID=UPI00366E3C1B